MNNLIKLDGPIVSASEETKYLVIFLHGWGSDGNDLIQLADYCKRELSNATFLAPNGPEVCSENPSGRQWFEIGQTTNITKFAQLDQSFLALEGYIENKLEKYNLPINNYFLLGFSQGTMLSIYYAIRKKCLGVIGYSGAFIEHKLPKKIEKNDFLLMHGEKDNIVPIEKLYEANVKLLELSNNVIYKTYSNLEHSINEEGLIEGMSFIKNRI